MRAGPEDNSGPCILDSSCTAWCNRPTTQIIQPPLSPTHARLVLHGRRQHYSCPVATLHTRHVCALASDATTRNQAKRLTGLGCQLFCAQRPQGRTPLPHAPGLFGRSSGNTAPHWPAPLDCYYRLGCASRPSLCCRVLRPPGATAFSRLWRACF